jgi:hypothetical protein
MCLAWLCCVLPGVLLTAEGHPLPHYVMLHVCLLLHGTATGFGVIANNNLMLYMRRHVPQHATYA